MNIAVGSVIGGVTNELAIRMLFRPLKPWYIGRWKVPFTPGLIPRRRDDIAIQMGRLVEEHLLTTEGVRRALVQGNLENTLAGWMNNLAMNWMADERTLRQALLAVVPDLFTEDGGWKEGVRAPVQEKWEAFVQQLLRQYEETKLRELLPHAGQERLDAAFATVSQLLMDRLRGYLHSPEGQQTLQGMVRSMLGGGGGMFGGLVGMFLGDDKIIGKILPALDDLLQSPELAGRLQQFLRKEAERLLDKNVGELVAWLGREQIDGWSRALFAKIEEHSLRLVDEPLSRLTAPIQETVQVNLIPRLAKWMVESLQQNVERIFPAWRSAIL